MIWDGECSFGLRGKGAGLLYFWGFDFNSDLALWIM